VDVEAVQVFTSLLSLLALAGAALLVLARLVSSRSAMAREAAVAVSGAGLWLAFVVALGATLGSLYFSEVARYVPCRLCWFQRIAMYPLVPVLEGGVCSAFGPSCADIWFRQFGFVTLAFMAIAGFVSIIVFTLMATVISPPAQPDAAEAVPSDDLSLYESESV
jgi:hypothetical protein